MLADRIEEKWIDASCEVFARCAVKPGDTAATLPGTQPRALDELAGRPMAGPSGLRVMNAAVALDGEAAGPDGVLQGVLG